jgi:hypothetical protein
MREMRDPRRPHHTKEETMQEEKGILPWTLMSRGSDL